MLHPVVSKKKDWLQYVSYNVSVDPSLMKMRSFLQEKEPLTEKETSSSIIEYYLYKQPPPKMTFLLKKDSLKIKFKKMTEKKTPMNSANSHRQKKFNIMLGQNPN